MDKQNGISYETTEKDWEDFFADWDLCQGTTYSVDSDHEWLCVASQHGSSKVKPSGQRLAESTQKQSGPPIGYEFDR